MGRELRTPHPFLIVAAVGVVIALCHVVSAEALRLNSAVPDHDGDVTAVAFSPDGQILASAGTDGAINLWRVSDGGLIRSLQDDSGQVLSLSFAPKGDLLASVSLDRVIRLWDPKTTTVRRVSDGRYPSEGVSFSPDGKRLFVSTSDEDAFSVFDVLTGRKIYDVPLLRDARPLQRGDSSPLRGNSCRVDFVALSHDGKLIASSDICGTVALRKAEDGAFLRTFERQYSYPGFVPAPRAGKTTLAFSADDTVLAGGSGDSVVVWNVSTGKESTRLEAHQGHIAAVAFPQSQMATLVTGSWNGAVTLWSLRKRQPEWTYTIEGNGGVAMINDVAFAADNSLIAVAYWKHATLINAHTGKIADLQ